MVSHSITFKIWESIDSLMKLISFFLCLFLILILAFLCSIHSKILWAHSYFPGPSGHLVNYSCLECFLISLFFNLVFLLKILRNFRPFGTSGFLFLWHLDIYRIRKDISQLDSSWLIVLFFLLLLTCVHLLISFFRLFFRFIDPVRFGP